MTKAELDVYVTATLPSLRKQLLKTDIDDDLLQEVLVWLMKYVDKIHCDNKEGFIALVRAHFFQRYSWFNSHVRRAYVENDAIGDKLLAFGGSQLLKEPMYADDIGKYKQSVDPWNSTRIAAMEYIELVREPRLKRILFNHYIEGYTLAEIGQQEGISAKNVFKQVQRGVTQIQRYLSNMI
jgi:RNA polymerase sigma factor (sigma-70 family)